jgi:hypothetical protein
MDEAFNPFSEILRTLSSFSGEFADPEDGVRTYITAVSIDTPLELDVTRGPEGALRIGTSPPLYSLMTSMPPSFHWLSFTAKLEELP